MRTEVGVQEYEFSLKEYRESRDLTLVECADYMGLETNTVWDWENGVRMVPSRHIEGLTQFYDIPISKLIALISETFKRSVG